MNTTETKQEPQPPDFKCVIQDHTLSDESREYALEQHRKWRQKLEDCDRSTLEALAMLLIQKRSVDGLCGRRWDACAHLYFDLAVYSLMRSMRRSDALRSDPLVPATRTQPGAQPGTPHKCPVCDGSGLVSIPPGVAADQPTFSKNV